MGAIFSLTFFLKKSVFVTYWYGKHVTKPLFSRHSSTDIHWELKYSLFFLLGFGLHHLLRTL